MRVHGWGGRGLFISGLALAAACSAGGSDGASHDAGADARRDGSASDAAGDGASVLDASSDAGDDGAAPDAARDATTDAGDAALPACEPPALGRGAAWVRANPMMISGLSVVMPAPSAAEVGEYFDGFGATAVHLWETGLPAELAGFAAAGHPAFRYISWVDRDGSSRANGVLLGGAAPLPGRIGYQIGDEPANAADLDAMMAGAAAVASADPDGLRIINLNDSSGANALRAQAIEAANIDVLSYDHYSYKTSAQNGLMATRTAALAAGKPYFRYMRSFFYKEDGPSGTPSDVRWDALVGAVYGFTGYTWFVYSIEAGSADLAPLLFSGGGDYSAPKTALYAAAASANRELAELGKSLALLESTDVRYVTSTPILAPASLAAFSPGAGGDRYLSGVTLGGGADALVGIFKDDCGERYVMVQNQAHANGILPNRSANAQSFTLSFDFSSPADPTLERGSVLALDPSSGAVARRPLSATGAATAQLTVTLEAGAVFFFKYANARPFVRQP